MEPGEEIFGVSSSLLHRRHKSAQLTSPASALGLHDLGCQNLVDDMLLDLHEVCNELRNALVGDRRVATVVLTKLNVAEPE